MSLVVVTSGSAVLHRDSQHTRSYIDNEKKQVYHDIICTFLLILPIVLSAHTPQIFQWYCVHHPQEKIFQNSILSILELRFDERFFQKFILQNPELRHHERFSARMVLQSPAGPELPPDTTTLSTPVVTIVTWKRSSPNDLRATKVRSHGLIGV